MKKWIFGGVILALTVVLVFVYANKRGGPMVEPIPDIGIRNQVEIAREKEALRIYETRTLYTNKQYGFEFQYPKFYDLKEFVSSNYWSLCGETAEDGCSLTSPRLYIEHGAFPKDIIAFQKRIYGSTFKFFTDEIVETRHISIDDLDAIITYAQATKSPPVRALINYETFWVQFSRNGFLYTAAVTDLNMTHVRPSLIDDVLETKRFAYQFVNSFKFLK